MIFNWVETQHEDSVEVTHGNRVGNGTVTFDGERSGIVWSAQWDHRGDDEAEGSGEVVCVRDTDAESDEADIAAGKRIVEAFLRAAANRCDEPGCKECRDDDEREARAAAGVT